MRFETCAEQPGCRVVLEAWPAQVGGPAQVEGGAVEPDGVDAVPRRWLHLVNCGRPRGSRQHKAAGQDEDVHQHGEPRENSLTSGKNLRRILVASLNTVALQGSQTPRARKAFLLTSQAFFLLTYLATAPWGVKCGTSSQSVITTLLPTEHIVPTHTLIFCTSVRWNLSILWLLLAGLALQVDSPSLVSSFRTSGVDLLLQVGLPIVLQVDSCFRIVSPSLFTPTVILGH